MSNRKLLPGKFVWFEHLSSDARKAQAFHGELLGWRVQSFPMGAFSYDMILTGESLDTMIGGYAPPRGTAEPPRWLSYVSVDDVDAAARAAVTGGGKVLEGPMDIPGVGRSARIADAQGAELGLLKSATGDKPDGPAARGQFFWNELHTSDAAAALSFHQSVSGLSHRSVQMGPGNTYHILSRDGVDRGGVTDHLAAGLPPHWLPYVFVDEVDATIARARSLGARIPMEPEDIPGVGRFGILRDPTGALLALMKPLPTAK